MVEQIPLSSKTPIIGAVLMLALLLCAAAMTIWDGGLVKVSTESLPEIRYLGERGYHHPPDGMEDVCIKKYNFWAYVKGNVIKSSDDSMSFLSVLDDNGDLNISASDLIPLAEGEFLVTGPLDNANMYSEQCGEGYFKLKPQN